MTKSSMQSHSEVKSRVPTFYSCARRLCLKLCLNKQIASNVNEFLYAVWGKNQLQSLITLKKKPSGKVEIITNMSKYHCITD